MKVLKSAEQKNVILNEGYYTGSQIREMLENKEICFFVESLQECYDFSKYWNNDEQRLHIFLAKGDEIKVELDDGLYTNVLIKANGNKYFIKL